MTLAATTATPTRGPVAGLAAQLVVLATLAVTVGLSGVGVFAGAAYGLVLCGLLAAGLDRTGATRLGPANGVTLGRAVLVGGVTALVVTSFDRPVSTPVLVAVAAVALAMDGVDGQVARRTRTTTALGARFDMEIDSFLVLMLSIHAGHRFGWWIVALGVYRYVFWAASLRFTWLTAATPPRFSRKVVAAAQGVVLAVATADLLPAPLLTAALTAALAAVTWSFALDIGWLHRARRARAAARIRWSTKHPAPALAG